MLQKLYRFRKFEESLGVIGLVYFVLLGIVTIFLVRFLVHATLGSLTSGPTQKELPPRYELQLLDEINKSK